MSNPTILYVVPGNQVTDVVLGSAIVVMFDQLIDPATVTTSTFSVTGPGQSQALTPVQLIQKDIPTLNGREYITGTFTFDNSTGKTVITFTPSHPFRPDTQYTILIVGSGALLARSSVKNSLGEALVSNYSWTFTTGSLNVMVPPIQSPLPIINTVLDPKNIQVRINGNNPGDYLDQDIESGTTITLTFPSDVDPNSFNPLDILLSVEQFLGDPTVHVSLSNPTLTVTGRVITITL